MDKYTLVSAVLEAPKLKEFAEKAVSESEYTAKSRKITVFTMFQYFLLTAVMQINSFRDLSLLGHRHGLPKADYSTLSRKASQIPYTVALQVCREVIDSSCRAKRRKLGKQSELLIKAVDSTRITACAGKWTWAPYLRESSGLKFHVAYLPKLGLPAQIEVSEIHEGDTARMTNFQDKTAILVCDRLTLWMTFLSDCHLSAIPCYPNQHPWSMPVPYVFMVLAAKNVRRSCGAHHYPLGFPVSISLTMPWWGFT